MCPLPRRKKRKLMNLKFSSLNKLVKPCLYNNYQQESSLSSKFKCLYKTWYSHKISIPAKLLTLSIKIKCRHRKFRRKFPLARQLLMLSPIKRRRKTFSRGSSGYLSLKPKDKPKKRLKQIIVPFHQDQLKMIKTFNNMIQPYIFKKQCPSGSSNFIITTILMMRILVQLLLIKLQTRSLNRSLILMFSKFQWLVLRIQLMRQLLETLSSAKNAKAS